MHIFRDMPVLMLFPFIHGILADSGISPGDPCSPDDCATVLYEGGPTDGQECFVDPSDPAFFASVPGICPCAANQIPLGGQMIYTGLDQSVTTAKPINSKMFYTTSLVWEYPMQSYNVALTTILPDSEVTVNYELGPYGTIGMTYTQMQSQSIFHTAVTSTIISTVDSQITTTQTATEIDISILPASTTTSPCTTGIQTFTAKPATITLTYTTTPTPSTTHKNSVSTVTTTLSCIPQSPATTTAPSRRSYGRSLLEKKQIVPSPAITFEPPRCADTPASTLNIVTATSLFILSVTSIDTSTEYTTVTIITSSQLPGVTLCSFVEGNTTTTSTVRKTSTKTLSRSTVTSVNLIVLTKTVLPTGLGSCSTISSLVSLTSVSPNAVGMALAKAAK